MPQRSAADYLHDILFSARQALRYVSGKTEEQYRLDTLVQDAVSWRLLIIGEAATQLLKSSSANLLPNLPWPQIKGMRNRLIHEYDNIRADIVWDTATGDLQSLINELESFLSRNTPDNA